MPDKPLSRRRVIAHRWGAWLVAVIVATIACMVLAWWQRSLVVKIDSIPVWSWAMVGALLGAILVGQLARDGLHGTMAFYDLRHFWTRPGYWVAVVCGLVIATWAVANIDVIAATYALTAAQRESVLEWNWKLTIYALLPVLSIAAASWVSERFLHGRRLDRRVDRHASVIRQRAPLAQPTISALRQWIRSDRPVSDVNWDFFGHVDIARRIADRIVAGNAEDEVSQAVVGRLGSGKTSVLEFVQAELRSQEHVEVSVVDIQMWPFETARAAVTGILERLIDQLGREVNVIGLRGMSGAYAEAVSMMPGGKTFLAALAQASDSPLDALAVIDGIARAAGRRYVIWIEDLERFAVGADADEKLGVVRALLYGLHSLPSYTVITATTDLSYRLDIEKIARYVERIPESRPEVTRGIVHSFVEGLRDDARARGCLLLGEGCSWRASVADLQYERSLLGERIHSVPAALDRLAPTPRALKQALRRCDEVWRGLAGEVDLDELLAMCIVREVQPGVFALIDSAAMAIMAPRPAQELDPMLALRDKIVAMLGAYDAEPVLFILGEIFRSGHVHRLQGLGAGLAHVNYWNRFNSIPSLPENGTDQYVLRAIASGDVARIVGVLEEEYGGAAAVYFASRFSSRLAVSLLVPLLRRRIASEWRSEERGARPPGFVPLWNIIKRVSDDHQALTAALEEAVDMCAERNLGLLVVLDMFYFADLGAGAPVMVPPAARERLKRRAIVLLLEICVSPGLLVDAVRGHDRFTFMRVFWGADSVRGGWKGPVGGAPFPEWPLFAQIVLGALEMDPDVMVPQIVMLVFSEERSWESGVDSQVRYEPVWARSVFGDESRVLAALRRTRPVTALLRRVLEVLPAESASAAAMEDLPDSEPSVAPR